MQAIAVPAFRDNYIWLAPLNSEGREVAVVDPGDARPVTEVLEARALKLRAILITHHHYDHVDGVHALRERYAPALFVPRGSPLPQPHHEVGEGDEITLAETRFTVLETPGHTPDHVVYLAGGALFTGDTLFTGGCGRLFGGSAEQLYRSLERLRRLPGESRIYCAHEYTLGNLRFACEVEPGNEALRRRLAEAEERRRQGLPTVPSTLALERDTNPFLRCHLPEVRAAAERYSGRSLTSPEAVFAVLRYWKDNFS